MGFNSGFKGLNSTRKNKWENIPVLTVAAEDSVFTANLDPAFQVHPEPTDRPILLYIAVQLIHVYFTETPA